MSLITLRSSAQDNGANVFESAAYWQNHFKKGIKLRPGNTLELVSMSINKIDKFEIITGQNDTFLWRIGAGASAQGATPVFQQHQITVPAGSYNGLELASTITQLCNTSTFIDLYKDQWTCTFTPATGTDPGTFTLNYGQRETPADNFNLTGGELLPINNPTTDGAAPVFTSLPAPSVGTQSVVFGKSTGSMKGISTATHLFQGTKGIFGNGGQFVAQVTPFRVLNSVDLAGALEFNDFKDDAVNRTGTVTALTPELSSYNFQAAMASGEAGSIAQFDLGHSGALVTGISAGVVTSAGTGYAQNDAGPVSGGTGTGATYTITTIGAGGDVLDYDISGGFGYSANDSLTLTGSGSGNATVTVASVATTAVGSGYTNGFIGTLTTVLGAAPTTAAKFRVKAVNPSGNVGSTILLGNFKGAGYSVGDVLRLDGDGDSECYIRVTSVQDSLEPYVGKLDEQGIFGMVSSEGKIWYDLPSANPFINSFGAGSTDNFDVTGAVDGGYTFRRNKSAGTTPMYWVQDTTQTNRFLEYSSLPITGAPVDTFDLIETGVFLSQVYNSTVRSASWIGGGAGIPSLQTSLATADQSTATIRYKYNATTNIFDFDGTPPNAVRTITKPAAAVFTPQFLQNYGRTSIGWVRNDLVTGRTKYPGDPNATFNLNTANCDLVFDLSSNAASTDIEVDLFQMNNTGNVAYPSPGWRTSKTVFSTRPGDWTTDLQTSAPAAWQNFTYGNDAVQIKIAITGIRTMSIFIAHDDNNDGNFTEEVMLIKSAQQGMGGQSLTLNTREVFYPLRPIIRMSRGSTFDGRSLKISGRMDTQDINQSDATLRSEGGGAVETWQDGDPTPIVGDGADPLNATKFSALFKFGPIDGSQVVENAPVQLNEVLARDLQPNTANMGNVFGFENVYSYAAGNATNATSTESGRTPMTQVLEPSLHVELPDFNIQSWSGESGDSTKAVAIIPREQWTTDATKGTLHWQAQYPQPVDLNLTETKMLYTLTARIREPSGELVKDLINPTELTLRIGQTDESRQQRVMDKAMERLAGAISNRQDQRISDIGAGMPKI